MVHSAGPGFSSGQFTFGQNYMRAADNTNTAGDLGLSWAAFMMGVPTAITIDTNESGLLVHARSERSILHDDWRLSNRLRLTSDLRYDARGGITERFNRGVGQFVYDAQLPFTDLVEAAYARNPVAELPASEFKVLGGSEYLGTREKALTDGTSQYLLPRIGVVLSDQSKTVLRGGYGTYHDIRSIATTSGPAS